MAVPKLLPFGSKVIVDHVIVRCRGKSYRNFKDGEWTHYLNVVEANGRHFAGRYGVNTDAPRRALPEWPGSPIPNDGYDTSPARGSRSSPYVETPTGKDFQQPVVRLRRVRREAVGIVIGTVLKSEGLIWGASEDDSGYFDRHRTTRLYEVALAVPGSGKAQIVLVWPGDLKDVS